MDRDDTIRTMIDRFPTFNRTIPGVSMKIHLIIALLLPALAGCIVPSCSPRHVQGTIMAEDWKETEAQMVLLLKSGGAVTIRFPLATKDHAGYDYDMLLKEKLTGKDVTVEIDGNYIVHSCALAEADTLRILWRVGERRE